MIYILEGPDGAGKSSLAKLLTSLTGFPIVHFSRPMNEQEETGMYDMYCEAIVANENAIFDRCWYAEIVYGNVVRNKSNIDFTQMKNLESLLRSNGGGHIIHCTTS